jgi:cytochrome P450
VINRPDFVKDVLVIHHNKFVKGLGLQRAKHLLGEGLLTSEGEFHQRQRRLMQPAFHREAIHSYGETMVSFASRLCDAWTVGKDIDIAEDMRRLTLAVVAKALFSADVERESADIGEALNTAVQMFQLGMPVGLTKLLYRLPLPGSQRLRRAQVRLDEIIERIIREHRVPGGRRRDVMTMLLEAQDVEGDGGRMTDRQIRDEALTLFLAGHETTAIALAWTWYLLSIHPDAESHLQEEVDEVLVDRPPTVADIPKLDYTRMVFTESLRLYPPAWIISRMAVQDHRLNGHTIPTGTHAFISPYLLHRDARYFSEPLEFRPERWQAKTARFYHPFAYIPFGAGPRNCIGESFAWMEGILILATIAQRWRFRLVNDHPIELAPRITLRPKHGIKMVLEAR